MAFTPIISSHNETGYNVDIAFDDPVQVSIGGIAYLTIKILETSVFKSLETLKPIDESSFAGEEPKMGGVLPPMVSDVELVEQITTKSDSAASVLDGVTKSNFVVGLVVGGSMQ